MADTPGKKALDRHPRACVSWTVCSSQALRASYSPHIIHIRLSDILRSPSRAALSESFGQVREEGQRFFLSLLTSSLKSICQKGQLQGSRILVPSTLRVKEPSSKDSRVFESMGDLPSPPQPRLLEDLH